MLGYYKDPVSTKQVIKDGFLFTGRKKNLIILSNGKNVSVEELENLFLNYTYVKEVCIYEENDKIVGEFYLDIENFSDAEELLKKDLSIINKQLPKYKNISKTIIRNTAFERNQLMKKIRKNN